MFNLWFPHKQDAHLRCTSVKTTWAQNARPIRLFGYLSPHAIGCPPAQWLLHATIMTKLNDSGESAKPTFDCKAKYPVWIKHTTSPIPPRERFHGLAFTSLPNIDDDRTHPLMPP
jgi:hypothetical protein